MSVPTAIVILLVVNAVAVTAMLLVRRGSPEGSRFRDGDRASGVFGMLGGGFAIFAGFIIFLAFTTYDDSRSGAETEALAVIQQFETAQYFPPAARRALGGQLVCYGRYVERQEWPQMEAGHAGDTFNPWTLSMLKTVQGSNPTSAIEQNAFSKWLDQTTDREEGRRDRRHGAEGIIPTPVWLVLFLLAVVAFTFMLFFADSGEGPGTQAVLMGSVTTVIVVTLLAIHALDSPFHKGTGQIQPIAMQRTLRLLDKGRAAVGDRTPVPCDARGATLRS
jgi:hypothetical protein